MPVEPLSRPAKADFDAQMDWSSWAWALLLCALWGGLAPAVKVGLEEFPPLALAAWRFVIGVAALLFWCRLRGISWRAPLGLHPWLIWLGFLMAAQIGILNIGIHWTSGARSAVLLNTYPIFLALLAHWFLPADRLSGKKAAGLLVAFAGIWTMFAGGEGLALTGQLRGDLLVLASAVILAGLQVQTKRLLRQVAPVQLVIWQGIYSLPFFFAASAWLEAQPPLRLSATLAASLFYQGVVVAAFCFLMWAALLQRHSASRLNAFQFTTPVFGVALSHTVLGDPLSAGLLGSVILISFGIYLVLAKGKPSFAPPKLQELS